MPLCVKMRVELDHVCESRSYQCLKVWVGLAPVCESESRGWPCVWKWILLLLLLPVGLCVWMGEYVSSMCAKMKTYPSCLCKACSYLGELLVRQTWFGQFNELYFISELNVRWTFRLPNVVWTVRQAVLHFLTNLLMKWKLQPELRCAGCAQTRVHMLTHDTCSLSSVCG